MSAHTPGPWSAQKARNIESSSWLAMVQAYPMAAAKALGMTREIAEANARLIAAAPPMETALGEVCRVAARINALQHAGDPVSPLLWSDLWAATNAAVALLAQIGGGA